MNRSLVASAGRSPRYHPTVWPLEVRGVPKPGSNPVQGVVVPSRTQVTDTVAKSGAVAASPAGSTSTRAAS